MEKELPKDPKDSSGIRKAVEEIFTDQGGAAIARLGQHLGREVQKVNKTQVRKFLTELRAIKERDEFALNRFRWVCRYLVAQEKGLKLLGAYLEAAAERASEEDPTSRLRRLQSLMESTYAHYCYNNEA